MHLIIQTLAMAYYGFYGPLEVTQDGMNFELLSNSDYPNPDVFYDDSGCLVILDDKNLFLAGGFILQMVVQGPTSITRMSMSGEQ